MAQPDRVLWAAALSVVFAACSRDIPPREYVARVAGSYLTEADVAAARDSSRAPDLQDREFVESWIINELLYQEAVRQGKADAAEVKRRAEDARRRLVIGALLDEEVYGKDSVVDEDEILALYNAGGEAFRLREDLVNLSFVMFSERDAGNTFRARILAGASWEDAVRQAQRDTATAPYLRQVATRQYFTQSILYPEELWKLARTLKQDELSFVLRTPVGYYVLMTHGIQRRGEMPDLAYIKHEIKERILVERRQWRYDRLLASLRSRYPVEIRIAAGDTAAVME